MPLYLIRHAHAGSRSNWDQADHKRPLSPKGESQSAALADQLSDAGIDLLWSSPSLRCRQTLEPLSDRIGVPIVDREEFNEGGTGPAALEAALAAVAAGHTLAVCSHGDVLPALASTALRRGAQLQGSPGLSKGARFDAQVADGQISVLVKIDAP